MVGFRPAFTKVELAQGPSAVTLPPGPDPLFVEYTGLPGFLETVAVLAILGSAAWIGIRTGLDKKGGDYQKIAGWVGGVGSALVGLFYIGAKSGLGREIGLPAVRVSPS